MKGVRFWPTSHHHPLFSSISAVTGAGVALVMLGATLLLLVADEARCHPVYLGDDVATRNVIDRALYLYQRNRRHYKHNFRSVTSLADVVSMFFSPDELLEGDIKLPRSFSKRNAINVPNKQWPDAVLPYSISDQFSVEVLSSIHQAFEAISSVSCIRFVEYEPTAHTNYVRIEQWDDCSSSIGMEGGGAQYLSLGASCQTTGQIMHEIMHTLGFWHEHSREDRKHYITINFPNIIQTEQRNFAMYSTPIATLLDEPYDYSSIMHYGAFEYAINPALPTITTLDPGAMTVIGQRDGLSEVDVKKLNNYYKCKKI